MGITRRKFSKEFKVEAVRLIQDRGVSVSQAARDLDVGETVLRRWVRELTADPVDAFPGLGKMKPEQEEIARLQKEVAKLKMERDILKKAAVSSTSQCNTICINHQEVLYGKDGTTGAVRPREVGTMAQMAGRPESDRHWFSPW
jgi:transposase